MTSSSRYSVDNFTKDLTKAFISANIKELKEAATSSYLVPPAHSTRWDLVSDVLYNNPHLKWLLIYINDIYDPSDLTAGSLIKYVPFQDLVTALTRSKAS